MDHIEDMLRLLRVDMVRMLSDALEPEVLRDAFESDISF